MLGSKPRNKDLTGQTEDGKLHGRYGKMIEDKLTALERKLTKQILCNHNNYSIETRSFKPSLYPCFSPILFYKKTCDDCGIDMGAATSQEKEQRDYELAKQKVEAFEESQLKEPEDLPVEATEFRGNFKHIKKLHRINKAKYILEDALDEKERIDSGESDGTMTDCHNILFKAVEQALLELSKD